jgi:membrane peptidoglycan carboxypeptidase
MVIIAEDSRFRTHHGIDFIELREAWAAGGHRGASTITQQLAKNLYPRRRVPASRSGSGHRGAPEAALRKGRIMDCT